MLSKGLQNLTKHLSEFVNLQTGKNVLLVRHGQSQANVDELVVGKTDAPLTKLGTDLNLGYSIDL